MNAKRICSETVKRIDPCLYPAGSRPDIAMMNVATDVETFRCGWRNRLAIPSGQIRCEMITPLMLKITLSIGSISDRQQLFSGRHKARTR